MNDFELTVPDLYHQKAIQLGWIESQESLTKSYSYK